MMTSTIRVAAAQTYEIIGDASKATSVVIDLVNQSKAAGASLICFPEAFLQGYVCEKAHVEREALSTESREFRTLLNDLPENSPTVVLGFIEAIAGGYANSAAIIQSRKAIACYRKSHLLKRESIFSTGDAYPVFEVDGLRFGVIICNDANFPETARSMREQSAELLVCCANNMFPLDTAEQWKNQHNAIRSERCRETGMWLLSSDVTGHRDECVALGPTSLIAPSGEVVHQLPLNEPGLLIANITI